MGKLLSPILMFVLNLVFHFSFGIIKEIATTITLIAITTLKQFHPSKQFIAGHGENPGVEYDLLYHVNHHITLQYRWIVGNWSACSATCARGK